MDREDKDTQLVKNLRLDETMRDDTVVFITKGQVPDYLKSSEFFASLSPEDDMPFPVPSYCFKNDTTVTTEEDVRKLLSTVRYWGVKEIVPGLVEYCRQHQLREEIASEFEFELQYVKLFPFFYGTSREGVMTLALRGGQLDLLYHLFENGYCFSPDSISHAIEGGNLECLQYVCRHAPTTMKDRIITHMNECAEYDRLDCLKYLHETSGYPVTFDCGYIAYNKKHVDCLQYIAENMPHTSHSKTVLLIAVCCLRQSSAAHLLFQS